MVQVAQRVGETLLQDVDVTEAYCEGVRRRLHRSLNCCWLTWLELVPHDTETTHVLTIAYLWLQARQRHEYSRSIVVAPRVVAEALVAIDVLLVL